MATLQSLTVNDTANLTLPVGTSANRPTINSTVQSFTTVGTTSWTAPTGVTQIEVLVVAGGGGGGYEMGGGGGGGGVLYNSAFPVTPGTSYTVTVGGGGTGRTTNSDNTNNAGNSVFSTITAIGGGAGGSNSYPYDGSNSGSRPQVGGSGGGSGENSSNGRIVGAPGTLGQGFEGGGAIEAPRYQSGGGGGAGGPGKTAIADGFGDGGPGFFSRISGSPAFYGGGGGGGCYLTGTPGKGGIGGGGAGGTPNPSSGATPGVAGTANTGGGGGGGSYATSQPGGAGGSGIVIIRYSLTSESTLPTAQTRFSTATGALETYNTNNQWNPQAVGNNIETHGLVLYVDALRYASGSATWPDLSGRNNNMTVVGSPSYSATTGFTFPSSQTTQYIILNPFSDMPTVGGTFELWVKTSGGGGIISYAQPSEDNNMLLYGTTDIGVYGPGAAVGSGVNIANDQWTHLVRTSNRNTGEELLYVNGELRFTTTINAGTLFTAGGSLVLGQEQDAVGGAFDAGQSVAGSFAVVRVYSRALSKDEITKNFNAEASRFYRPPKPKLLPIVTKGLTFHLDATNPASFVDRQGLSGLWSDLAAGNSLTLTSTTYSSTVGGNIVFNGTSSVADATLTAGLTGTGYWTMEAWFKVNGAPSNVAYSNVIVDTDPTGGSACMITVDYGNGHSAGAAQNQLIFASRPSSGGGYVSILGPVLAVGTWYHAIVVREGSYFTKLFTNGVLSSTYTGNLPVATQPTIRLGRWTDGTVYANVSIGVVKIYNRALTDEEVRQNYSSLRNRYGN